MEFQNHISGMQLLIGELIEKDDGRPSEKLKKEVIDNKFEEFVNNEIQKTIKQSKKSK